MAHMQAKHMKRGICWGIDLTAEQARRLREYFGEQFTLCEWASEALPGVADLEASAPCALWLSLDGHRALASLPAQGVRHLDLLPRILLLPAECPAQDLEEAIDTGAAEIIRAPFTEKALRGVMFRVVEGQRLQQDMLSMTREIALEREQLDRKHELLAFLADFLTKISGSLELDLLLRGAREGFGKLFPIRSLHAALWEPDDPAGSITLVVDAPENSPAHDYWSKGLLDGAAEVLGFSPVYTAGIPRVMLPVLPGSSGEVPEPGYPLRLPLVLGAEKRGVLILDSAIRQNLGREQTLMLEYALRHLFLSVRNAQRFLQMREIADHDELTRLYNRRHFEFRLNEETDRFSRYGQSFSLLLLDVDHFKKINDTYGHTVGDEVLRGLAHTLSGVVRFSDYCARYGGEEFCIILPGSSPDEAHCLAERIRAALAAQVFHACGYELGATVSIGITGMYPGDRKECRALLCEADSAMYAAKVAGRNTIRHYTPEYSRRAV